MFKIAYGLFDSSNVSDLSPVVYYINGKQKPKIFSTEGVKVKVQDIYIFYFANFGTQYDFGY